MDGILTFFRDPIWGFISFVVAGIIIPIVLWRLSRLSKPANPKNQNNAAPPPVPPQQQQVQFHQQQHSPPLPVPSQKLGMRTRIITCIILLLILAGSFLLFWPLIQNPLSYSQTSIQWGSFNTWFWWILSGFPAALCWVMVYDSSDINDISELVVVNILFPVAVGIFCCLVFCSGLLDIFHSPLGFPIGVGIGAIFAFFGIYILAG